ncbi:MAG: hypothetical protein ACTSVK_00470 [Promethearchaeota archaeon]
MKEQKSIDIEKQDKAIEIPRNVFNSIVEEVRKELLKEPKVSKNRNDYYGLCGTAADLTAKKICQYLKEKFGPNSIKDAYLNLKVYYLKISNRSHHITIWGKDLHNSWKIDPTIDQFKKFFPLPEDKFIFSPKEQYPLPIDEQKEIDIFTDVISRVYLDNNK